MIIIIMVIIIIIVNITIIVISYDIDADDKNDDDDDNDDDIIFLWEWITSTYPRVNFARTPGMARRVVRGFVTTANRVEHCLGACAVGVTFCCQTWIESCAEK